MAKKEFTLIANQRTARPRSKRLRELGVAAVESGSTVVNVSGGDIAPTGDGHTHENKKALDAISIDTDFYEYLTQDIETTDEESGEATVETVTEKVKAGYADDAAHAAESDHATDADTWAKHVFSDYLDQALRKTDPVTFAKVVAALAQSPDFIEGISTGKGWRVDGGGNAELESLVLRRFLEVPELRYNRVSVNVGNSWRAPGGGIIASAEPDYDADGNILNTGVITLHLEDGEIGLVALDDICMGIYHNDLRPGDNALADSDDGIGNFKFSGFYTTYFRVTEILASDNGKFRYAVRPVSDTWPHAFHPCEAMHFVAYGNFSDRDRQTSRYSTRTYERYLKDVASWEFGDGNIGAQFGDLSNLSIFGLEMEGYSAYLANIYMSGTIEQFKLLPYRMEIDTEGEEFLAYGESVDVTCTVWKGWDDVTSKVVKWKVERDTGVPAEDAAWALTDKAKNFAGSITIEHGKTYSDLASSGISTLFTMTAYMTDGSEAGYTLAI